MSELAMLSLRDVAPLGIPASLPAPPAPNGGYTFDQHLAEASQRQQAEAEPREEAPPREPEGEYRRLELPPREDQVREPARDLKPVEEAAPRAETPLEPTAPTVPAVPKQEVEVATVEAPELPETTLVLPETPAVIAEAPADPAADPLAEALAETPLITPSNGHDGWKQPALNELFPEYFSVLPTDSFPAATSNMLLPEGIQLPVNLAGAPLGITASGAEQPAGPEVAAPPVLTARERRYGLGLGKPFQGHAAVNRRHLDRFGRDIPLPTTFVARTNFAQSAQLPLSANTAELAPEMAPLMGTPVGDKTMPMAPATNPLPLNDTVAPELPLADDDTPTFGSQVAYRPQAVHLRATTPGFGDRSFSDQSSEGEAKNQGNIATAPMTAVAQSEEAQPQDFGNLWRNAIGRTGHAPPSTTSDPITPLPEALPLKDASSGPISLNGLSTTITRGAGESNGKSEVAAPRETVAFRNIAADLTAKLSKDAVPEGATRLRVTLRPRELGTITIELIRQGDQLETRITTRTKEAQALFEKLMPELKVQLEERGFNVRSLDLSHQQQLSRDAQGHAFRDEPRANHGWEKPPLPRPLIEIPEPELGELDLRDIVAGLNLTV